MEDRQIIELYNRRDEQAIAETERAYGRYCFSVANNILLDRSDAEEVVADMLMNAWSAIPPQQPQNLKLFLAKITRNLALSKWRARTTGKRGGGQVLIALEELGDCVSDHQDVNCYLDKKELGRTISMFLRRERPRDRAVFLRRYFYLESTAQISRQFGLTEANVLQILSRTRKKLKKYLIQEGYVL